MRQTIAKIKGIAPTQWQIAVIQFNRPPISTNARRAVIIKSKADLKRIRLSHLDFKYPIAGFIAGGDIANDLFK
ncbi:hypothetical protein THIOM_004821 [Candidatus Thiomargarita nelsonii]|uniref:Uncharacterized protein n=1 Tax=Candidatus Thiomargarita nelsonii TaxID=1003181 RepID=A0A176RUW8_9GAMM|nr:hypothetical protein THIOM_004821 [Candidatus Thiomargarita nelsonii]